MQDPHPGDVLEECVCKLAFIADTLSFFAFRNYTNFAPVALSGLYQIVADIERDLSAAAPFLAYQPPKGDQP